MSTADDNDRPAETATDAATPQRDRGRLPGPGLGESILWIVGFLAVQIACGVGMALAAGITSGEDVDKWLDQWSSDVQLSLLVLPMFVALVVLIPAAAWRLKPDPLRKLNIALPSLTQFVILLATTVAMALFCTAIQTLIQPVFEDLMKTWDPDMQSDLEAMDIQRALLELRGASTITLLLAIAVLPAVTEELLFRGLIGRGLVARWGKVMGIALTTLLFAAGHGYPPTVIALIPLAILMHVAYLTTCSFWAPIIVHLTNNALSVLMLKYGVVEIEAEVPPEWALQHWIVIGVSGAIGVFGMWSLGSVRTRYLDESGDAVLPVYPTVEAPPRHLALRRSSNGSAALLMFFAALLLVEAFVFWTILQPEEAAAGVLLPLTILHP